MGPGVREWNMEEKWSIDKLNGSNWNTWKFQMKHLLLAKGLRGLVEGSEVLEDDATTTAQALYRSRLQKAFSTIVLAIDSAQLYLRSWSEEPKQAWDALRKHFERETLANKLFLKKRYFRSEMKEGTPVEQHLKLMKDITDKLVAIGEPISVASKHSFTKKWSNQSYPVSRMKLNQHLRGLLGEIRHTSGHHVLDVVLWVMFAVIVQAIRPVSS